MGREEDLKNTLFQSIIEHARQNRASTIDKAYEYYWEELQPDEFLGGTALELGFINFEDWLVFDYKSKEETEGFIELYIRDKGGLSEEEIALLRRIKDSIISLYEVESVSKDKRIKVKDLLIGGEFVLKNKALIKGLKKGDVFAARLLELDGNHVMSGCAYPYTPELKKRVIARMEFEFGRYRKNENPQGAMRDFLKAYGDLFNIIWIEFITGTPEKKT